MTCGTPLLKQLPAAFLGAALVLAFQPSLAAQAQATTGVIRGVVSDPSGNVVAGARVIVTDVETRFQRTVVTNEKGVFVAPLLPLGTYEVTARGVGLGEKRQTGIVLRVGETTLEFKWSDDDEKSTTAFDPSVPNQASPPTPPRRGDA